MNEFRTVSVVGLGYIGLPTAAVLASRGIQVIGVDTNPRVLETVARGEIHIAEPDLEGLVQKVVSSGALRVAAEPEPADAFIIAVPTPLTAERTPCLDHLEAAARALAPVLTPGDLVIIESTSPVGTAERLCRMLAGLRPELTFPHAAGNAADVQLAYCPERVMPGRVITELVHNDRVIGGMSDRCAERAAALYQSFVTAECFVTSAATAELVKLVENAFRDVNLAFANELSLICERLGLDAWEVIRLANRHPRVDILNPGPGVGGHCIAVDPWFIVAAAPAEARLIRTAREVNDAKPEHVVARIKAAAARFAEPSLACLGLTFKADVDDIRESPALAIVERLAADRVGRVLVADPQLRALPAALEGADVTMCDALSAIDRADVVVLLVNHRQFRMIDPTSFGDKVVIDTRGLWRTPAARLRSA